MHSDRTNIVFGPHLLPNFGNPQLPPDTILINLEQVRPQLFSAAPGYREILLSHRIWDHSERNVQALREMGANVTHVPIGYVPELVRVSSDTPKDIDVLFYGTLTPRRQAIADRLGTLGIALKFESSVYGAQRDALIARAKIVLNIGAIDNGVVFDAVRVCYLLANRAFVISEGDQDPTQERIYSEGVIFGKFDLLTDLCVEYLGKSVEREKIATRGQRLMQGRKQSAFLEQALEQRPK
ncbi:MAG: hypothetical protein ACKVQK_11510 [Burkholderiales bacterium]